MRIGIPDNMCYTPPTGGATLSPFNYPLTVIRGENYILNIPVTWSYPSAVYYGATKQDWVGMNYFSFGARLGTQTKPQIIDYFGATTGLNTRSGSYLFPVTLGIGSMEWGLNLYPGSYTVYIHAETYAYYWDGVGAYYYGEYKTSEYTIYLQVIEGLPTASFTASPLSGDAPLTVDFLDTSTSPVDITDWLWEFGDGTTATTLGYATHIYSSPGTYIATLTVTNPYGSAKSSPKTITVTAGATTPVFNSNSWCTTGVKVNEPIDVAILVDNIGAAGNIFLKFTCEGKTTTVINSTPIAAYATAKRLSVDANTIDWYLGYVPERSRYVQIIWQIGPVGGNPTDEWFVNPPDGIAVYVTEGEEGEEKKPWWILGAIGAGLAGLGIYYLARRKK